jgi:hypothetical protein
MSRQTFERPGDFFCLFIPILLLGGDKTGKDRWYEEQVPKADDLYDEYLRELKKEGLI